MNFTFETFKEDYFNRFALDACKAISSEVSDDYKFLWVHGPKGRGKTHLTRVS